METVHTVRWADFWKGDTV